jgi:hypothetical protein
MSLDVLNSEALLVARSTKLMANLNHYLRVQKRFLLRGAGS